MDEAEDPEKERVCPERREDSTTRPERIQANLVGVKKKNPRPQNPPYIRGVTKVITNR